MVPNKKQMKEKKRTLEPIEDREEADSKKYSFILFENYKETNKKNTFIKIGKPY